jgi:hypothetical protein
VYIHTTVVSIFLSDSFFLATGVDVLSFLDSLPEEIYKIALFCLVASESA